jgi:hypothetical protein
MSACAKLIPSSRRRYHINFYLFFCFLSLEYVVYDLIQAKFNLNLAILEIYSVRNDGVIVQEQWIRSRKSYK